MERGLRSVRQIASNLSQLPSNQPLQQVETEHPLLASGGSAQMRGLATGVGSKADIGAPPLTQL